MKPMAQLASEEGGRPLAPAGDVPVPRAGAIGRKRSVEANTRLTAATGAVIFVLLAVEGATVLRIRPLLSVHVLVGMMLVPPVLLKMASTGYRFARYYFGDPAYRRKGPPPALLRVLAPLVVLSTLAVIASGIALLLVSSGNLRSQLLTLHKASFVVWFAAMTVHVLGHIAETARIAPLDWYKKTAEQVGRAKLRQWAVAASVAAGVPLGLLLLGRASSWLSHPFPH
jgi:hypothetical protein